MRKTKSEGKTVGILIGLRNSQSVRKLFARLRISQCSCEIGKAVANFANHIAKFAMRNFAKDFDIFVRQMNSAIVVFEFRNANFALPNSQCQIRNAKWLPTVCQNSCFAFSLPIFNICSKICTKLLKLKQEKLHKGTN